MRRTFLATVIVVVLFISSFSDVIAGETHWLQYRTSRERNQAWGSLLNWIELSKEKPWDMDLLEFKSDQPWFAKWQSPLAENGFRRLAFDRSYKAGPCNILYFDSNGDGKLSYDEAINAYQTDQHLAYFGPVPVMLKYEGEPIMYHLNFRYYSWSEENTQVHSFSGGWYEGNINLSGQSKFCMLIDYNANAAFNDISDSFDCDRIHIGSGNVKKELLVGNYLEFDSKLYEVNIAADGACIELSEAEDVTFGEVQIPETVTDVSLVGENGLFERTPQEGKVQVPVGKYKVYKWTSERNDDDETNWKLQASVYNSDNVDSIEVSESNPAIIDIGEPLKSSLKASGEKGTHSFRQSLGGRHGENIQLLRNGSQPRPPKVRIKNEDGSYDKTFSFEYG